MRVHLPSALAVVGQVCLVVAGLVALSAPASGTMLLLPLAPGARAGLAAAAIGRGAQLLGAGPVPGSLVVRGERRMLGGLWSQGVMVTAAPAAACGERPGAAP